MAEEKRIIPRESPFGGLPEDSDRVGETTYFYPRAADIIKLSEETSAKIEDAVAREKCLEMFGGLLFLFGAAQVKFAKAREALSSSDEREFAVQLEWAQEDLKVAALRATRITEAYLAA